MLRLYYLLTKPGIVYGNVLASAAGYVFAAGRSIDGYPFVATMFGVAAVVASGCVVNNVIDRRIDKKMKRTQRRALLMGSIGVVPAVLFGLVLGVLGFGALVTFTNTLTVMVGAVGYIFYVAVYAYAKRNGTYGTVIGALPGAVPLIVGYLAVAATWDITVGLLFLVMVLWQLPHFYAIAIYRKEEYAAAGLPVMPVVRGISETKRMIKLSVIAFFCAAVALGMIGGVRVLYLIAMLIAGAVWVARILKPMGIHDDVRWARGVFGSSLMVLLVFCAALTAQGLFDIIL